MRSNDMSIVKFEDIREDFLQAIHNARHYPKGILAIPYTHIEWDRDMFVGVDDDLTPYYTSDTVVTPVNKLDSIFGYPVKYSPHVTRPLIVPQDYDFDVQPESELEGYYWQRINEICRWSLLGYEQVIDVLEVAGAASIQGIDSDKILIAIKEKFPHHADEIDENVARAKNRNEDV